MDTRKKDHMFNFMLYSFLIYVIGFLIVFLRTLASKGDPKALSLKSRAQWGTAFGVVWPLVVYWYARDLFKRI